jgi:hypothetical protein
MELNVCRLVVNTVKIHDTLAKIETPLLLVGIFSIIRLEIFLDILIGKCKRIVKCTKECIIRILYAKVTKVQSFLVDVLKLHSEHVFILFRSSWSICTHYSMFLVYREAISPLLQSEECCLKGGELMSSAFPD